MKYQPKSAYGSVGNISTRMGESGTVTLRILVGPDGKVLQAEVEKSSGYKRLDELARTESLAYLFEPSTLNGKPHQAWVLLPMTFRQE